MGILVRFVKPDRPNPVQTGEKREAEIIMFTGVRYEREQRQASQQKRAVAKRKQKIR